MHSSQVNKVQHKKLMLSYFPPDILPRTWKYFYTKYKFLTDDLITSTSNRCVVDNMLADVGPNSDNKTENEDAILKSKWWIKNWENWKLIAWGIKFLGFNFKVLWGISVSFTWELGQCHHVRLISVTPGLWDTGCWSSVTNVAPDIVKWADSWPKVEERRFSQRFRKERPTENYIRLGTSINL